MYSESEKLEEQINSLKFQLETYPEGSIFCSRNGNRYKWYHSVEGSIPAYIPKANKTFAQQLAAKKYLSLKLEDLLHEKRAIDFYLRHHTDSKAEQLLTDHSEYQKLLSPFFQPQSKELSDWMNAPFNSNSKYPEYKVHKTVSGNLVRSKSEALIDMALHVNQIPFRYECALQLGKSTVYPDFTIRHPCTGKVYYWEHFGKMDDSQYSNDIGKRLQRYISHGIIPNIQLITTYETSNEPLSTEEIDRIITTYFK